MPKVNWNEEPPKEEDSVNFDDMVNSAPETGNGRSRGRKRERTDVEEKTDNLRSRFLTSEESNKIDQETPSSDQLSKWREDLARLSETSQPEWMFDDTPPFSSTTKAEALAIRAGRTRALSSKNQALASAFEREEDVPPELRPKWRQVRPQFEAQRDEESLPIRVKVQYRPLGDPETSHLAPLHRNTTIDSLFAQLDHDPRELCDGIGHVVSVWRNPRSGPPRNIGMIVGLSQWDPSQSRRTSEEALKIHREFCGPDATLGRGCTSNKCPIKYHYDHCVGMPNAYTHAEGCPMEQHFEPLGEDHPMYGRTLAHVSLFRMPTDDEMKRGRTPYNWEQMPRWEQRPHPVDPDHKVWRLTDSGFPDAFKTFGPGSSLVKPVIVPIEQVAHIRADAADEYLSLPPRVGKIDLRPYFSGTNAMEHIGSRATTGLIVPRMSNPFRAASTEEMSRAPGINYVVRELTRRQETGDTSPIGNFDPDRDGNFNTQRFDDSDLWGNFQASRTAYTHVTENYQPGPTCRFCDEPSYVGAKGPVVQTGTAPDGRPLTAHETCEPNHFEFANSFRTLDDDIVNVDFIQTASHDYGIKPGVPGVGYSTQKVDREIGITTPSKEIDVQPGFATVRVAPHGPVSEMSRVQVDNLIDGVAQPPKD